MSGKTPFYFWSNDGSVLPLVLKLKREGHPVTLYIHSQEARDIGRGLVPKTTSTDPEARSIIVFDGVGHGAAGTIYRKRGFRVIGGNPFDADLEKNRPEGARVMRSIGIRVPETHPFRSIATAVRFLEGTEGAWFVKLSGDQVESSTYDAPTSESMIRYLRWCDHRSSKIEPFELQRKAEGTEVSINGWFDGQRFIPPYDVTLEEKRFLAGDLGPRTGCESNLVWFSDTDALSDLALTPLEDRLSNEGYVGPLDLNCLVDPKGIPTGLEWTARLGLDALYAWMSLFERLGEQLEAFAEGSLSTWEPQNLDDEALTLRVTIPPYPTWDPKLIKKSQGLPVDPSWLSDPLLFPVDVMLGSDGLSAAGGSGIIGAVGASGDSEWSALRMQVLDKAESLEIPNKQYRHDPISRADRDYDTLRMWT